MKHYHYIFTGSGLSALMMVYEMILSRKFNEKSILLIDENPKKTNDRTWCFWDESAPPSGYPSKRRELNSIISKKWNTALFANEKFSRDLELKPYQYNMIRGLDFYNLVFDLISNQDNIHFANQKVIDFEELGNHCIVKTELESYTCDKIFNSIFNPEIVKSQTKYPLLQQHFIGWFI